MPKEDDIISYLNQPVGLKGDLLWKMHRGLSCITANTIKEYCSGHKSTLPTKGPDQDGKFVEIKQDSSWFTTRQAWHAMCFPPCGEVIGKGRGRT
jgi:hypothetical protein